MSCLRMCVRLSEHVAERRGSRGIGEKVGRLDVWSGLQGQLEIKYGFGMFCTSSSHHFSPTYNFERPSTLRNFGISKCNFCEMYTPQEYKTRSAHGLTSIAGELCSSLNFWERTHASSQDLKRILGLLRYPLGDRHGPVARAALVSDYVASTLR